MADASLYLERKSDYQSPEVRLSRRVRGGTGIGAAAEGTQP